MAHLKETRIHLIAEPSFMPIVTTFVEKSALAFGLAESEALSLTLAAEEVFQYLASAAAIRKPLSVGIIGKPFRIEAQFIFEAEEFNLAAFNITSSANPDIDPIEQTGLLIASRMIDRFDLTWDKNSVHLTLVKEKAYPAFEKEEQKLLSVTQYSILLPDDHELKTFVQSAWNLYDPPFVPSSFSFPGKIVDMAGCEDLSALIAADKMGHICGGILWREDKSSLIEMYGPFVFNGSNRNSIAEDLTNKLIESIAKRNAIGLIARYPTEDLPTAYFERLGSSILYSAQTHPSEIQCYYRELREDLGIPVWTHPVFENFLLTEYKRLFFPRERRSLIESGESVEEHTVFFSALEQKAYKATLQPIVFGRDALSVLESHVEVFTKENIFNIFFEMDLGHAWHCRFGPALAKTGFKPSLIIPHGGQSDILVFQYQPEADSK